MQREKKLLPEEDVGTSSSSIFLEESYQTKRSNNDSYRKILSRASNITEEESVETEQIRVQPAPNASIFEE